MMLETLPKHSWCQ